MPPRHAQQGWLQPAAKFAAPAVIAAVALSMVTTDGPASPTSHPAASVQLIDSTPPMEPFAATPISIPFAVFTVVRPQVKKPTKSASPPIAKLPRHLDVTASAIPRRVLASYVNATKLANRADPICHLKWQVLAGVGFIESDHARSGGSDKPGWNGIANPPIYGPLLDGQDGFPPFPDTDHGAIDGNTQWDRAVGPMQFMPSTWAVYAADGNHDGVKNPQDIDDATLAAANYLCASSSDLNRPKHLIQAIHSDNHSYPYARAVLTVIAHYMNINPAKLGINGLPHRKRRHTAISLITPPSRTPSPTPSGSAPPSPTPSPSSSPSPSGPPFPTPTALPTRSPTPSPTPTPRLPHR
jgi:membrane-bound lytic murein transglycosylase B